MMLHDTVRRCLFTTKHGKHKLCCVVRVSFDNYDKAQNRLDFPTQYKIMNTRQIHTKRRLTGKLVMPRHHFTQTK